MILLDPSAAFDTVNHCILMQQLINLGVSGTALMWLQSFLEERSFQVFKGDAISKSLLLHCGVPQGSSLSPTLFNVYMAPLADIVIPFGVQIVTYADDTQLVVALNHSDSSPTRIGPCLQEVTNWMKDSHLKLNSDKTQLMILRNPFPPVIDTIWPACLGQAPTLKSEIKSLGFWLNSDLSFKVHARKVAASCFSILRMLRKVLLLLPFQARKLVVQALILSRLDYGNALYLGAPSAVFSKLQIVQNCAARILMGVPSRQSSRPALKTLHWLPVRERVNFKALHSQVDGREGTVNYLSSDSTLSGK